MYQAIATRAIVLTDRRPIASNIASSASVELISVNSVPSTLRSTSPRFRKPSNRKDGKIYRKREVAVAQWCNPLTLQPEQLDRDDSSPVQAPPFEV